MKAIIDPETFKRTIKDVTRFPMTSALAGSELVYMSVTEPRVRMYGGVSVLARVVGKAQGSLPWVMVDSRAMAPFADRVTGPVSIAIAQKEKLIKFHSGDNDLEVPWMEGPVEAPKHPLTKSDAPFGVISDESVKILKYLSALVPDVQTRPDLSCVIIDKGRGIASSQRTVAVVDLKGFTGSGYIPAPLANNLLDGDSLYAKNAHCTLDGAGAVYTMALPDEIKQFPIAGVEQYLAAKKKPVGTCDGSIFAAAMKSCSDCLGFITKLGAFVEITPQNGKLVFLAQSGSAKFTTKIAAKLNGDAVMYLPVEEAVNVAALCEGRELTFSVGAKNGELYLGSDIMKVIVASGRSEE